MAEDVSGKARRQLEEFDQKLGLKRGEGTVRTQDLILEEARGTVNSTAQELLGVLAAYRRNPSPDYYRTVHGRGAEGIEVDGRKVEFHGHVSEWIHAPRSLPDGSHVVIEFRSRPQQERGRFGWLDRERVLLAEDTSPIPTKDGVFLCRVTIIPASGVTPALIQRRLDQAPLNYTPEDYPDLFPYVWIIGFGDAKNPSVSTTSFAFTETEEISARPALPVRRSGYPAITIRPLSSPRIQRESRISSVNLSTGAMEVETVRMETRRGFSTQVVPFGRDRPRVHYGLDGEKLVEPGKTKESGKDYVGLIKEQATKLHQTLQQVGI